MPPASPLSVQEALALINQTLDEVLRSRKAISMLIPAGHLHGLSNWV